MLAGMKESQRDLFVAVSGKLSSMPTAFRSPKSVRARLAREAASAADASSSSTAKGTAPSLPKQPAEKRRDGATSLASSRWSRVRAMVKNQKPGVTSSSTTPGRQRKLSSFGDILSSSANSRAKLSQKAAMLSTGGAVNDELVRLLSTPSSDWTRKEKRGDPAPAAHKHTPTHIYAHNPALSHP
jgi:hypothetical protein